MGNLQSADLTGKQRGKLEKLLKAGFRFVTLEHVERFLAVEKDGFIAMLEAATGRLRIYGQAGLRMAGGIGMLVERGAGKWFVWHSESVAATPALLARYETFRKELEMLLGAP